MKNIPSYNEFVNESFLNESKAAPLVPSIKGYKSDFSPGAIKKIEGEVNKSAIKEFKKLKIKSGKSTFTFRGFFDWYPEFFANTYDLIVGNAGRSSTEFQFNDADGVPVTGSLTISDKLKTDIKEREGLGATKKVIVEINSDEIKAEFYTNGKDIISAIKTIFIKLTDKDKIFFDIAEETKKQLKVNAISIGSINIQSGKTQYGWSIYDSKGSEVYLVANRLLYAAKGTFEIGDIVSCFDNDSGRSLELVSAEITDIATAKKDDVVDMLAKNGYDYSVAKPFKKKKSDKKLNTSYSVKGVEFMY